MTVSPDLQIQCIKATHLLYRGEKIDIEDLARVLYKTLTSCFIMEISPCTVGIHRKITSE